MTVKTFDELKSCAVEKTVDTNAFEEWLKSKGEERAGHQRDEDDCPIRNFLVETCAEGKDDFKVSGTIISIYDSTDDEWVNVKIGKWADLFVTDFDGLGNEDNDATGEEALKVLRHSSGWEDLFADPDQDDEDDDYYEDGE